MEEIVKTKPRKANPKIEINKHILAEAKNETEVEKQVIVHCFLKSYPYEMFIRIWMSTYLRDKDSSHKSKLLTAHNITIYPQWLAIRKGRSAKFTLVFSALPKSCTSFDLFEDIPEHNGFYSSLITRNKSDVYSVDIDS